MTAQVVAKILGGGAAINVLARDVGARVVVVDAGVADDLVGLPGLVSRKVRHGTANLVQGPAVILGEARQAVDTGIALAQEEIDRDADLIGVGSMGVGGTSAAAAILAVFAEQLATGAAGGAPQGRAQAVQRALDLHKPDATDSLEAWPASEDWRSGC